MGVVSGLSLTSYSDSGSFLVAHAWLSQDGTSGKILGDYGRACGLVTSLSF